MKTIGFKPTDLEAEFITKRLSETHKSQSKLLHEILKVYMETYFAGGLNEQGELIEKKQKALLELRTAEEIKTEHLRAREQIKVDSAKAISQAKRDSVHRKTEIDWGASVGIEDSANLGDGFYGE